jgi:DNA-binding NtrC family response regulator
MSSPHVSVGRRNAGAGRILLYGHYPTLLQTRRWILEKAGFRVWIATQFAELENILTTRPIDLLILSHTLPARDCEKGLAAAHQLRPKMKALVLTETSSRYFDEEREEAASAVEGPNALIAIAKKMVALAISSDPTLHRMPLAPLRVPRKAHL